MTPLDIKQIFEKCKMLTFNSCNKIEDFYKIVDLNKKK